MPRYDYQCEACNHSFELKQSFSSKPVADCPVCNKTAHRVIHSVPVVFKGSGWYVNDYGKRGGPTGTVPDSKESGTVPKSKSKAESTKKGQSKSKDKSKKESAANK